jgi:small subunit ribosomal protein S6
MPIYELFCLARPQLARAQHAEMFRSTAKTVLDGGGVLTDLKSFGERRLAYRIRNFGGIFSESYMWQISFAAKPQVLEELQQQLKLDERILRHIFVKKDVFKPLPTTSTVKKQASQLLKAAVPASQ